MKKFCITAALLVMIGAGCASAPKPAKLTTSAKIRENIVGNWTAKNFRGTTDVASIRFIADGTVYFTRGKHPTVKQYWRMGNEGWIIISEQEGQPPISADGLWAINQVDHHKLIFYEGPSSGPPWRFSK